MSLVMCDILWDTGWCGATATGGCVPVTNVSSGGAGAGAGQSVETCEVRWPVTRPAVSSPGSSPGPSLRCRRPQLTWPGGGQGCGGWPGHGLCYLGSRPELSSPRLVQVAGGQASTGHRATAPPPLTYIFTFLGHKTTWQLARTGSEQWAVNVFGVLARIIRNPCGVWRPSQQPA